ncbi:MAG: hypothetical protein ACE5DK_05815 [Paracoccaceae bacterium]
MFEHYRTAKTNPPILRACLGQFGAKRCIFGSNFPVDSLYSDYKILALAGLAPCWLAPADIGIDLIEEVFGDQRADHLAGGPAAQVVGQRQGNVVSPPAGAQEVLVDISEFGLISFAYKQTHVENLRELFHPDHPE